ncbi:MAG: hypothetical protein WC554_13010 [Clostridia bacterium]|jgi:hypothetical protein
MMEMSDRGNGAFVRVEFIPEDNKYDNLETYRLIVDQPDTPEWWTENVVNRTKTFLREIIKRMIISSEKKCLIGGQYILTKDARIGRCVAVNVVAMSGLSKSA